MVRSVSVTLSLVAAHLDAECSTAVHLGHGETLREQEHLGSGVRAADPEGRDTESVPMQGEQRRTHAESAMAGGHAEHGPALAVVQLHHAAERPARKSVV